MSRAAATGSRARFVMLAALNGCCLALLLPLHVGAETPLPSGFAYLRDVEPAIAQDMRYASQNNFVGRPLPGYGAAECVLRRDAAAALKQVQSDLAVAGLALKAYDCYRPTRAVRAMAQWANDGRRDNPTKRFYPTLHKEDLFALGYIAARSQHSTGTAIDLTLIQASTPPAPAFDPAATYGACTGPAAQRAPDNSIDMGTGYDCFDTKSHTASGAISAEQRRLRNHLVAAMAKRGFSNYHREWWHYEFRSATPKGYFDIPIRPRGAPAG
jgi:zinc D-Ala-D-Ala dipeptidase